MSNTNYGTLFQRMDGPEGNEFMELGVYYSKGGGNAFTGEADRRGMWMSCWPIRKEDGGTIRTLMDSRAMRFHLQSMGRKNDRLGENWFQRIRSAHDAIATAAIAQDWGEVRRQIENCKELA